ncbi:hypothetical protein P879_01951 [Paragonimus westermani]|uniref:G-protein coupled receptors family 1 profile domain-containing protein n=1 Tax=Paragonimus westermani TaxID=34504 RepID=A0A8T0DXS3_9TREM|nr:hypothetical protein P879_01951 [Paragonimus westermani]
MLAFIVLMFGICWLPSHVFFLLLDFTKLGDHLKVNDFRIIYAVCHWIAMSNSFVNPIIYLLMSQSFKRELCQLVRCLCPWKTRFEGRRIFNGRD